MSHKYITKVAMTMVSLLRLKGYEGQAGFSVQVSAFWSLASRFWLLASIQQRLRT
jgi:hypothetical protein